MTMNRSFTNQNEIVDHGQAITFLPNEWGLLNEMGIFQNEYVASDTVQLESKSFGLSLIPDTYRGTRNNVNSGELGKILTYSATHHPLDDALYASELVGRRRFGTSDQVDTEALKVAEKLERMRKSHAITLEAARWHTITTGTQYSPNGTRSANFYADAGVSRFEKDLVLGTATTEVGQLAQEAVASIQDTLGNGEVVTGFVAFCGPTFFKRLTSQANIKQIWGTYSSQVEPFRNGFRSGQYQRFVHQGIEYIEIRGGYNGTNFVPTNDAYLVARGSDAFKTFFTPAQRFDTLNSLGEEMYAWSQRNASNTAIEFQSESNHVSVLLKPQGIARLFTSN